MWGNDVIRFVSLGYHLQGLQEYVIAVISNNNTRLDENRSGTTKYWDISYISKLGIKNIVVPSNARICNCLSEGVEKSTPPHPFFKGVVKS